MNVRSGITDCWRREHMTGWLGDIYFGNFGQSLFPKYNHKLILPYVFFQYQTKNEKNKQTLKCENVERQKLLMIFQKWF